MFGSCWTCGGQHYAHECPKGAAGGGKGGKGKSKGEPQMKGKGKGKSRAPLYGSCWICGGAHFQTDCPAGTKGGEKGNNGKAKGKGKSVREVDEEHEDVGSVTECWNIFGVDVVGGKGGGKARPGRWVRQAPALIPVSNRFTELAEVDEDDGDVGEYCTMCENCCVKDNGDVGLDGRAAELDWIERGDEAEGGKGVERGEIVVDSGAAESVCPWNWAGQFPMRDIPRDQKRDFRNASGGKMNHYGEKKVRCGFQGLSSPVSMTFQVSDCRNPLASVARITEQGNVVQFGPREEDNYIYNPRTDEKIQMRRKGRKFVLDANFQRSFSGQA